MKRSDALRDLYLQSQIVEKTVEGINRQLFGDDGEQRKKWVYHSKDLVIKTKEMFKDALLEDYKDDTSMS